MFSPDGDWHNGVRISVLLDVDDETAQEVAEHILSVLTALGFGSEPAEPDDNVIVSVAPYSWPDYQSVLRRGMAERAWWVVSPLIPEALVRRSATDGD